MTSRIARIFITLTLLTSFIGVAGCVERRLSFRTNIRDAQVMIELDGVELGYAPTEVVFDYYGTREWVARPVMNSELPAYEMAWGEVVLDEPWYEFFPFDFFAEVLWPFTIVDQHEVEVVLTPMAARDPEGLLNRATGYRAESNANKASLHDPRDPNSTPDPTPTENNE